MVDATGAAAGVVVGLRGGAAVVPCRTVVSSVGVRTTFERLLPAEHRHRVARPLKALQDPALAPPSCCHLMLFVALGQHSRLRTIFLAGPRFTLMHDAPLCSRRRRRRARAAGLQLLDCRKHHHFTSATEQQLTNPLVRRLRRGRSIRQRRGGTTQHPPRRRQARSRRCSSPSRAPRTASGRRDSQASLQPTSSRRRRWSGLRSGAAMGSACASGARTTRL